MSGKHLRLRACVTFVLSVVLPRLCGQQLPIRTYTASDGLPHNDIVAIVRDSHGFLWFCTPGGLSRFDGYQFTNYGTTEGLPSANVYTLLETRGGEYWVGTAAGLCRFNPKAKGGARFTVYRPEDRTAWVTLAITEDRAGGLWVGTRSGLYRFQPPASERSSVKDGKQGSGVWSFVDVGLSPERPDISALVQDSGGTLWVGSPTGLFRREPNGHVDQYWQEHPAWPDLSRLNVYSLAIDRNGALWAATWGGLWKIPRGWSAGRAQAVLGLPANKLWSLVEARDGQLWAAVEGSPPSQGNLCAIDEQAARVIQCYSRSNGISGKIVALGEDQEGDLWLGTGGLGALREARHGFVTFPLDASTDVLETKAGEICVGRRLDVGVLENGRLQLIRPRFPDPTPRTAWGWPQTILQDRSGDWWFPTDQGLYRFGPAASVKSLAGLAPKAVYTRRDGLASDETFRLFDDREGNVWVSSSAYEKGHSGLSRWERATGKWRHYFREPALPDVVRTSSPSFFSQDHFGAVWIGFWDGSLARFRDDIFQFFTESDGWGGGGVQAIHADSHGTLWIGSRRGLTCIPSPGAAHPQFLRFSAADGLSGNDVASAISDDSGRLYIATGHGVDQIEVVRTDNSIRLGHIRHYTTAEGLSLGAPGMAYRDRNGTLWFQGDYGLSQFQPDTERPRPSTALIRGLRIAGVPVAISELGESALSVSRLKPGQNNIQIEYSGLNFAPGETLRYQYMLEGADSGWSEPTVQRSVNYANLAPGSYRFRVRAAEADGGPVSSVVFTIDPPLWSRWWFLTLVAAGVLAAGTALYRMRVEHLLELERVRTRIATDLHDDIGSNLSQIAILSEVALQKDGDSANHEALAHIAEVSRETVHSMSDIVWAVDPEHDRLSDLVNRMHRFANDLLGARGIRLHFQSSGEQQIRVAADVRREIFLIFKECVNNAARHSGCDAVDIELTVESGRLQLKVADNGKGLDPCAPPTGHGLASMRKRAQGLAGDLEVVSGDAGGVTVQLRVPLSAGTLHV